MTVAGTMIGRFELLRLLAAGGMGEVYLARQRSSVEGFAALVAIKVLLRNLSSNQNFVHMFLEEARIVGRLHHKNIVQIRDVAQHETQYYMAMEYIPGQNLRELLGDVSIPDKSLFGPRLGAEIFAELADALAAAHAEGLVHRDISPNNVMIGDEGVAKLIDFGVARALTSASLTSPGTLKGKFGYMAPEYVRGEGYDHRVDIFSFGVVMWETFARRRLFRGTTAAEQLHQLLNAEVPRLDAVVPGFPDELATIVEAALERDPLRRISSAAILAESLGDLVQRLERGPDASLRKWLERRLPGRIDDRSRTDRALMTLAPGAPIPDFGPQPAFPDAGSIPGTFGYREFGYREEPQRSSTSRETRPDGPALLSNSATSVRMANGETQPPPAPPAEPRRSRAWVIVGALSVVVIALIAFVIGSQRQPAIPAASPAIAVAPTPPSPTPPSPSPSPSPSTGETADVTLHRKLGLEAMSQNDYARARREFTEVIRAGGTDDDRKHLAMVTELEHEASRPPPTVATPAPPSIAVRNTRKPADPPRRPPAPKPPRLTVAPPPVIETQPAGSAATPEPPAPTQATLVVTSVVPKSIVSVDGKVVGQTPLKIPVAAGDHRLEVKLGDKILHASAFSIAAGDMRTIVADKQLEAPSPTPPVVSPRPKPTPRVTGTGDVATGARVVGACNACHARTGAGGISARRYTRAQWDRFFASGQHDRYVPIGDQLGAGELMAAKAFLRANAADTAEDQGAGVRENR